MSALTLHRIDAARHMARFYRMDTQRDLFGAWCFIREWGRIGRSGQVLTLPFPTEAEAQDALDKQRSAKERRGYTNPQSARITAMAAIAPSASSSNE